MKSFLQRVAVKVVIVNEQNQVLILRKSSDNTRHFGKAGRYNLPGGKITPGESLETALLREVQEETNLNLQKIQEPFFADGWFPETTDPLHVIGIFYSCIEWEGEIRLDDEHDHYVWIPQHEVIHYSLLPPEDHAIESYFHKR